MGNYKLSTIVEYVESHARELTFEGLRAMMQDPECDAQLIYEYIEGIIPGVDEPGDVNGICVLTYALYTGASKYVERTAGWDAMSEFQCNWLERDAYNVLQRIDVTA